MAYRGIASEREQRRGRHPHQAAGGMRLDADDLGQPHAIATHYAAHFAIRARAVRANSHASTGTSTGTGTSSVRSELERAGELTTCLAVASTAIRRQVIVATA